MFYKVGYFTPKQIEQVEPGDKKGATVGDSRLPEVFKQALVAASCSQIGSVFSPNVTLKGAAGAAAGIGLAGLASTTGATVGLHEVVGHGLLGFKLTSESGDPTYSVAGWEQFQKMEHAGSFKDGLVDFFKWIGGVNNSQFAGMTYYPASQPNGIGHAMGVDGRSAWMSIAGSLPGLALDTVSVIGGVYLRKRSPMLGNMLLGFGLCDNLINSTYALSAAVMSDSQLRTEAASGHDFANFSLKISDLSGIPAHTIAVTTGVFWLLFVPLIAGLTFWHTKSDIGEAVPDVLALRHWILKAEKDPKIRRKLERYYKAYPKRELLAKIKVEELGKHPLFTDFIGYLLEQVPGHALDQCKKEILASWEKNLASDRIQTALTGTTAVGTVAAVASQTLDILSLAIPSIQSAATILGYISPLFIGASVISSAYQVYKDFQCPDSNVPKAAKIYSVARLVLTIALAALAIVAIFVPGVNAAFLGALAIGGILNIALSYRRTQLIRRQFKLQQSLSPEVWSVMYPLWQQHQKTAKGKPMNKALSTWTRRVSKKVDLEWVNNTILPVKPTLKFSA
jgi:hypothetical protein